MFESLILAGGQGTRLKDVTGGIPKPMVDVNGKPFIYYLMERLVKQGCSNITLSLCYRADYIIDKIENDNPVPCKIDYCIEPQPLGTGGAIKFAMSKIKSNNCLILNGDTISEINYQSMINLSENSDLVISGMYVPDTSRYGTLLVDSDNNLISMCEKGKSGEGIINSGVYYLNKSKILNYHSDIFSFETDFIKSLHTKIKTFISNGYFIDIGIPEDYYKACRDFSSNNQINF